MARVEIYQPKTDNYARLLARRRVSQLVRVVSLEAKIKLARYTGNTARPGPTGQHRRSIRSSVGYRGRHLVVGQVGSNLDTALVVHIGARPHRIRARSNDRPMIFFWKLKGRVVKAWTVRHPGMDGKFYLTEPLRVEGRRLGFRVVTAEYGERLVR